MSNKVYLNLDNDFHQQILAGCGCKSYNAKYQNVSICVLHIVYQ